MMINSNGDRKPRRSSLKFTFDPVNDASDGIVSSRGLNRRVSFSQYVFVLGDEDDGSQMCVSRFNSNISVEDEFANTNNDINNNDNNNNNDYKNDNNDNSSNINDNMESVTSISDVSMELSHDSCLKVKHESFNEQQNTNMEVDNDADSRTLSSKCSSLESVTISSLDEMMIVKNELSCTPRHHDVSDMEVQSSICPLPLPINEELCNMSIISTNELNLSTNNDGNIDKNLPGDSLPHKIYSQLSCHNDVPDITSTIKNNEDVNHEKVLTPSFRSPHFLQSTNTMMMTDIVEDPLLSDKRPVSVVKMPLINLNLSNSLPLTRRRCNINKNLQSDVDQTPKPSEPERITFVSLINTPLRQANIGDDTGANLTSVKKVIRPKTFRDVNEYKPERLLSNTRRLHNHLRNQLAECQLEAVIDHIKYDFSNIKSIVNFLRKNEYIDCNLETLDKSTLLTDMDRYGSDEYLRLQNQLHLHLYDKLVKRRFVIETENINRLEFWKRLYLERISTVLISPQLKSVTKNVSEMNLIEHLKFIAGAQQLFHTCSKFAQQEIYQIIDENISARNLELNLEIDNLNQLNDYLELMISQKQSELKQKRQEQEQLLELETYAKEILQKLNRIKQEIDEITQRQIVIRQSNKKLLQRKQYLEKKLKELSEQNCQEELYNSSTLVNRSIGCTELFPIPISETSIIQHCNNNDRSRLEPIVTRQLINLLSPCRITCTSFDKDNHMYEVSTLFGLVNFLLTCQVCDLLVDDSDRKNNNNHQCNESIDGNDDGDDDEEDDDDDMQTTVNPENLKVISVQVVAPADVECPVECPPVESVARIFIEYLNTVGYDNLRTRCIGFTMADVIETIETIIVPFMVLASDLRSLWLAKCDVNLVMPSIDDQLFTGGYFTPKKLRNLIGQTPRSTAVHSLSTSHRTPFQSKQLHHQSIIGESMIPVEKSLSFYEYLTPSEPLSITVKFSTRNYRIMVRFTLMSLDYMDSSQGSVEFEVLRGNLRTEKLEEYFESCKPTCGNLYSIISKLQLFLSSSV